MKYPPDKQLAHLLMAIDANAASAKVTARYIAQKRQFRPSFEHEATRKMLRSIRRSRPIDQSLVPPVDMLAPSWASLPLHRDADVTVTADPSVEDRR